MGSPPDPGVPASIANALLVIRGATKENLPSADIRVPDNLALVVGMETPYAAGLLAGEDDNLATRLVDENRPGRKIPIRIFRFIRTVIFGWTAACWSPSRRRGGPGRRCALRGGCPSDDGPCGHPVCQTSPCISCVTHRTFPVLRSMAITALARPRSGAENALPVETLTASVSDQS